MLRRGRPDIRSFFPDLHIHGRNVSPTMGASCFCSSLSLPLFHAVPNCNAVNIPHHATSALRCRPAASGGWSSRPEGWLPIKAVPTPLTHPPTWHGKITSSVRVAIPNTHAHRMVPFPPPFPSTVTLVFSWNMCRTIIALTSNGNHSPIPGVISPALH